MGYGFPRVLPNYLMGIVMTKASWIADKISDLSYVSTVETIDSHTLVVGRAMKQPLKVACTEADPVDAEEINRLLASHEALGFVAVIPSDVEIDQSAWLYCENLGITLGRFSDLRDGLEGLQPNSKLMKKDLQYICNRIERTGAVQALSRVSETALRITCSGEKRFIADFTHPYEMTEDEVLNMIHRQPDMEFLVVTNPYARGLSPDSVRVADDAGVRLMLLSNFVSSLSSFCRS